jgi:hypothetical protein
MTSPIDPNDEALLRQVASTPGAEAKREDVSMLLSEIDRLPSRYDEEHKLRCDIERRFDYRYSDGGGEVDKAKVLSLGKRETDTPTETELRESLGAVILHAQALDAILDEVDARSLMWLKVLIARINKGEHTAEELRKAEREIVDEVAKMFEP